MWDKKRKTKGREKKKDTQTDSKSTWEREGGKGSRKGGKRDDYC